jgi:hypothetical protein
MDKNELNSIINYNEHAIFMSEIAEKLLENEDFTLIAKGIRELIAMYLLVPYITNTNLDKPEGNGYNIPKLDIKNTFMLDDNQIEITLDGLRNAICHSFITIEENKAIILDDRASCSNKNEHDKKAVKSNCNSLNIEQSRRKLLELHRQVIQIQKEHNKNLIAMTEVKDE